MAHYKKNIIILDLERKHNSVNGNPTWRIFAGDENGDYVRGETASDAACAYNLGYYSIGRKYAIEYHYTKNGTRKITQCDEIEKIF